VTQLKLRTEKLWLVFLLLVLANSLKNLKFGITLNKLSLLVLISTLAARALLVDDPFHLASITKFAGIYGKP